MKTILVLSPHPDFAEGVRTSLNPQQYRVIHRLNVEEAEPLIVHGLATACILDADLMGVESVWVIERLRRRDARTPIIAYTETTQSDWEEEAFLRGVTHILTKPVRHRLLNSILERLVNQPVSSRPHIIPFGYSPPLPRTTIQPADVARSVNASQTLDGLHDFSSMLTHSLDAEAMRKLFFPFLCY